MMWHHGGWGAGAWLVMGLFMVMFWTAVVLAVVWLVRSTRHPTAPHADIPTPPPAAYPDPARRILDERFARGELTEDEYRRHRDVLAGP